MTRAAVELESVGRSFTGTSGQPYTAVRDVTLTVSEGSFLSIVGPSGCGKSTLLNVIAGLIPATEGRVSIYGDPLHGINRRAAYMFQQDALLPWKTVLDNIMLGLTLRGMSRAKAESLARSWVTRVGLSGFADAFPYQLSGGMRKRVAMAQCWIVEPDLLLMDEPFSALDIHTRQLMESELLRLWSDSRQTVVFVTHDLDEAIALSDEVVVLSAGPGSHIVNTYTVDLTRPRDLIDLRTQPDFINIYNRIWADLKKEVLKSHERSAIQA